LSQSTQLGQTDGQTDGEQSYDSQDRASIAARAVKIVKENELIKHNGRRVTGLSEFSMCMGACHYSHR